MSKCTCAEVLVTQSYSVHACTCAFNHCLIIRKVRPVFKSISLVLCHHQMLVFSCNDAVAAMDEALIESLCMYAFARHIPVKCLVSETNGDEFNAT